MNGEIVRDLMIVDSTRNRGPEIAPTSTYAFEGKRENRRFDDHRRISIALTIHSFDCTLQ
jgi:hypothetical protein